MAFWVVFALRGVFRRRKSLPHKRRWWESNPRWRICNSQPSPEAAPETVVGQTSCDEGQQRPPLGDSSGDFDARGDFVQLWRKARGRRRRAELVEHALEREFAKRFPDQPSLRQLALTWGKSDDGDGKNKRGDEGAA